VAEDFLAWALSGEERLTSELSATLRGELIDPNKNGAALAKSLGLDASSLQKSRNYHLRAAACKLEELPLSKKAIALDKEIQRFSSGLWLRHKDDSTLPEGFSELQKALFLAMKTGLPMPLERQLARILQTPYPSRK
jgi:hypothetical protein